MRIRPQYQLRTQRKMIDIRTITQACESRGIAWCDALLVHRGPFVMLRFDIHRCRDGLSYMTTVGR